MISVQNHLQRLSGNKVLYFIFASIVTLVACTVSKPAVTPEKDIQIVKAGKTAEPKVQVKEVPVTPNSQIEKPAQSDVKVVVKVDTIIWKDVSSVHKPIEIKNDRKANKQEGLQLKDEYNISLLIPLNSDGTAVASKSRFVHFYAGVLQALEKLEEEDIKLNIRVIDTEEGTFKVSEKYPEFLTDDTDLVIGPFERDDVRLMADVCKARSIPLVSPWQTSTRIANENPYYLQMKPNLKEHFLKLAEATTSVYNKGEVAIIGLNNKETSSWVKYFQDATTSGTGPRDFYSTYFVSTDSLNLGPTAFFRLFKNTKIKAVIIPNYSYTDEDFIYSCLRRLAAEKGSRPVSVYGMPILYDSDKIDFDFYHSLQMKVVMSDFVDEDHGKIREFRRDFLDKYGEIPDTDAVKGYDLMLYLGRNIWKYGKNFQQYLENEASSYLQSIYDIRKAKSEDSPVAADPDRFDFYENKHLDIIEFRGNKWQKRN